VLMLVSVGSVHYWFTQQIEFQSQRNKYIKNQIAELDVKIKAIVELDVEKDALEARMTIIQELQSSRPEIVHLFDEVVMSLPEGIFYKKIAQKGRSLTMTGVAQSNARVSSLMRNIESSDWMKNPRLQEIKRDQQKGTEQETLRLSNFVLTTSQQGPKVKVAGEDLGDAPAADESS
jgi:type IV pilus assembly protein PilN